MSDFLSIGSVQYSILEPGVFTILPENVNKWVLMDGQNIHGSALWQLTQMETVPDARGIFLRGMNMGRDGNSGDPDGNRTIGSYQGDDFRSHNHDVSYANQSYPFRTSGMGIKADQGPEIQWTALNFSVGIRGGAETRPKNIPIYIYIKIN